MGGVALARNKCRTLFVGGFHLLWCDAFLEHSDGDHALLVQDDAGDWPRLVVLLPWYYEDSDDFTRTAPRDRGTRMGHGLARPLWPGWVARCAQAALDRGWRPDRGGHEQRTRLADLLPNEPLPPRAVELKAAQRARRPSK